MFWKKPQTEHSNWHAANSILIGVALLLACVIPASASEPKAFVFAVTPHSSTRNTLDRWRPLLDQLEIRTGYRFKLAVFESASSFNQELKKGQFDFVYLNPYSALRANHSHGYLPLVRDTGENLQGILVVRKDNPMQDLHELQGKVVAFPSPSSLGATLLQRSYFANARIEIQPRYVGTHDSVYLNVVLGQVTAGGGILESLNEQPAQVRDNLRIIHHSAEYPSHPIMAHPQVPAAVRDAVQSAFLALDKSTEGRALLAHASIKKIGPTNLAEYAPLGQIGLEQLTVEK